MPVERITRPLGWMRSWVWGSRRRRASSRRSIQGSRSEAGDLAPLGVQAIDGGDRLTDMDEAGGQVEQGDVAGVPGDQPQVGIDHADALIDVVERGLEQFAVELDGLGRLVEHPHHVLGRATASGEGGGDDAAGRGGPDGSGQHPLGGAGEAGIGGVAVLEHLPGLAREGGEGPLGPRIADEARRPGSSGR